MVHIFFRTHVNGLEKGYSISFIWGPDYQTKNVKGAKGVGAKGVGAIPISFWGTYTIRNYIEILSLWKVNSSAVCQSV